MFRVPPLVVTPTSSVPGEAPRRADSMMAPVTVSELLGLTIISFMALSYQLSGCRLDGRAPRRPGQWYRKTRVPSWVSYSNCGSWARLTVTARHGGGPHQEPKEATMPKYVIERKLPGAGKLSAQQLQAISQKSNEVLRTLGPEIQWVQSYVTDDTIYCVYVAPSEELIRQHAKAGGFPADRITPVRTMIDPTTAE